MSEHKPGTVATVIPIHSPLRDARVAVRTTFGRWSDKYGNEWPESVLAITPLVCIEATREDADLLDAFIPSNTVGVFLCRLRDAIREQTPEPEPPKRWTVHVHDGGSLGRVSAYLYDKEKQVGALYDSAARSAQSLADALNNAEGARP